jgi:hypothetical protein
MKLKIFIIAFTCIFVASACNDDFLSEDPKSFASPNNLYTDLTGFEAGLNSLYANLRYEKGRGYTMPLGILYIGTDIGFYGYSKPQNEYLATMNYGEYNNPENNFFTSTWGWAYETINAANTIIDRAENENINWTENDKNRVIAEAKWFRARMYKHLTYMFGDVPLVQQETKSVITDWARTPKNEVLLFMIEDLKFAEMHLPETAINPGKLVKAAAQHELAEIYLIKKDYSLAEEIAEKVINSGLYELMTQRFGINSSEPGTAFSDMFLDGNVNSNQGNKETILALQQEINVVGGGHVEERNIAVFLRRVWGSRYENVKGLQISEEYGGRGVSRIRLTPWVLGIYEPVDDRASEHAIRWKWYYNDPTGLPAGKNLGDEVVPVGADEIYHLWPQTRKWDYADPNILTEGMQFNDIAVIRLAETILFAAEAEIKQNKNNEATVHINMVRQRANASEISASGATMDFLLDERARELVTEVPRRYTLLRTGKLVERVRLYNEESSSHIQSRDTLFAIPQGVIDANIGIEFKQNPGF